MGRKGGRGEAGTEGGEEWGGKGGEEGKVHIHVYVDCEQAGKRGRIGLHFCTPVRFHHMLFPSSLLP